MTSAAIKIPHNAPARVLDELDQIIAGIRAEAQAKRIEREKRAAQTLEEFLAEVAEQYGHGEAYAMAIEAQASPATIALYAPGSEDLQP